MGKLVGDLKEKYIKKALELTNNNKSQTARLPGYKSYQALTYDIEKSGIFKLDDYRVKNPL